MQTLTIQANADFIEKAKAILITLAKLDGAKLNLAEAAALISAKIWLT